MRLNDAVNLANTLQEKNAQQIRQQQQVMANQEQRINRLRELAIAVDDAADILLEKIGHVPRIEKERNALIAALTALTRA